MAYNGYPQDMEGIETSGPKVTVREVSHSSFLPCILCPSNKHRSSKTDATLFSSHVPYH